MNFILSDEKQYKVPAFLVDITNSYFKLDGDSINITGLDASSQIKVIDFVLDRLSGNLSSYTEDYLHINEELMSEHKSAYAEINNYINMAKFATSSNKKTPEEVVKLVVKALDKYFEYEAKAIALINKLESEKNNERF